MGIFNKSARNAVGVNSHFPYTFICLTSSFSFMREEGLIDTETYDDLFDALLNFWDYAFSRKDITQHEYTSYFLMTQIPPKENFKYSYELEDSEMPVWESIVKSLVADFQKYRAVDLRGTNSGFGENIPNDVVQIIERNGYECPVGSPNFVMAYAVATTFAYIITRTDTESRMDRLGKRQLATEILPVFLAFWYFRKKL